MTRPRRFSIRFGSSAMAAIAMAASTLVVTAGTANADDVTYRSLAARHTTPYTIQCIGVNAQHYAIQTECFEPWSLFYIQPSDDGAWRLVTQGNKCLEVRDGSLDQAAIIQEGTCNSNWKQQWWINGADGDWREIANRRSSLCMGVENAKQLEDGIAYLRQYECDHNYAQQFLAAPCFPGDEPAICGTGAAARSPGDAAQASARTEGRDQMSSRFVRAVL